MLKQIIHNNTRPHLSNKLTLATYSRRYHTLPIPIKPYIATFKSITRNRHNVQLLPQIITISKQV